MENVIRSFLFLLKRKMKILLIINCRRIYTMSHKLKDEILFDGYINVENGKIIDIGQMCNIDSNYFCDNEVIDAENCDIYPGFIDSHTHLGMFTSGESYDYSDANETVDNLTPNLNFVFFIN